MAHFDIKISKGSYSVELHSSQVEDGFVNKLYTITPGTGKQTQSSGAKEVKVVDLLRITRTFRIAAYLLYNSEKNDLIKIIEGGGVDGGGVTLTYSDGGDATEFTVFTESCVITQVARDSGVGWLSGQDYKSGMVVDHNGSFYNCILDIDNSTTAPASDSTHFTAVDTDDPKFELNLTLVKGTD